MMKNIKQKIKKEFQNREIKPSNNSWEILNAQLEVTSAKKQNKKWRLLAYAAIFIGLLFSLVTFLNTNNNTNNKQPIIVDVNPVKVNKPINEKVNIKEDLIKKEEIKVVKIINKTPIIKLKRQETIKKPHTEIAKVVKKESIIFNTEKLVSVNKITNNQNPNKELIAIKNTKNKQKNPTQISNNLQSRQIRERETNPKKKLFSTDADIDLMLANALHKNDKNTIQKVNIQVTYLQYSIENEISTPIKNKILKTLKAGVDTVEAYIISNN